MKKTFFQENTSKEGYSSRNVDHNDNRSYYIPIRNQHFSYINPRECGYHVCPPLHGNDWLIRDDLYLIHCIISGEGTFYTEEETYNLKAGQCFLIKKYQNTKYFANADNPWYYTWVGFDGEITKELDKLESPIFTADKNMFEKLIDSLNYTSSRELYLIGCISFLLSNVLNFTDIDQNTFISRIKNYINTNYMYNIKISDVADSMNISPDYLTYLFKKHTGFTLQQYIVKRKMKAAQNFLETGLNVTETAQALGYSDHAAFSRAYKNYYGYAPSKNK